MSDGWKAFLKKIEVFIIWSFIGGGYLYFIPKFLEPDGSFIGKSMLLGLLLTNTTIACRGTWNRFNVIDELEKEER